MQNPVLEANGVQFQNSIQYPNIIIYQNEPTFITGKSGSGKSTFLRFLNATQELSCGEILYRGKNIQKMDTLELRKKVLLVNQNVYLFEESIRENFRQFYEYRQQTLPAQKEIEKYLALCCAPFSLELNCGRMSGGERQRIFTAIFLSFMPDILLLDEPTSALDEATSNQMIGNIIDHCANSEITMVTVSHDEKLVKKFAEKHIVLEKK